MVAPSADGKSTIHPPRLLDQGTRVYASFKKNSGSVLSPQFVVRLSRDYCYISVLFTSNGPRGRVKATPDLQAEPDGYEPLDEVGFDAIAAQYTTPKEHGSTKRLNQNLATLADAIKVQKTPPLSVGAEKLRFTIYTIILFILNNYDQPETSSLLRYGENTSLGYLRKTLNQCSSTLVFLPFVPDWLEAFST